MKNLKRLFTTIIAVASLSCFALMISGCSSESEDSDNSSEETAVEINPKDGEVTIDLNDGNIKVNGQKIPTDKTSAVYSSHDIVYYEDRDTYDSGNVYGEGSESDKHTTSEADDHTVVNITQAGTYRISGTLSLGQISVDLGENAKTDPEAVVTLILDGADITCTVAPCIIFYNVYECDTAYVAYSQDESLGYTANYVQDTSAAGANIVLADNSTNNLTGSHVAKIYKDDAEQKTNHKYDGTCYSRMSMNVDGDSAGNGVLNIVADNEGLDTELHLTINGGKINIQSDNDGINTNEDGASVTTINDGSLHIVAGLGEEGDGVDSNGYLTINGGTVIAIANPVADSGLDGTMGSYINGGYVVATGSTMDWPDSESDQVTINLQFASTQDADEAIIITQEDDSVIFAYDPDQDETTGSYNRGYLGAVLSCPSFAVGDTYYVYVGGDIDGNEVDGLYDAQSVTGFSGATRQVYSGTDINGMGGFGNMSDNAGGMNNWGESNFDNFNTDDLNWDDIDLEELIPDELLEYLGLEDLNLDDIQSADDLREIISSALSERGIDLNGENSRFGGENNNREDESNGEESGEGNSGRQGGRQQGERQGGSGESNNTNEENGIDTLMPDRTEQNGETTGVRFDMGASEENSDSNEGNDQSADNAQDSEDTQNSDNAQGSENGQNGNAGGGNNNQGFGNAQGGNSQGFGNSQGGNAQQSYEFYMTDMVNSFSGVQDEA